MMNKLGKYPLRYHAEQVPNPESRIRLWGQKDQFGMPRVTIDLRFTKPDVQSVIRSHQILDKALQDNGFGKLNYLYPQNALAAHVYKQASDGYHQYGTTRMGVDPKRSVVDAHLRVHDIKNLYIASSSVCPTAGQANPTLLGVALGVRLINEIIDEAKNTNHVHSQSNRFTRYIDPRVRPGHVLSRTA